MNLHAASPADIEKRINGILSQMTLEEKLGQMSQLDSIPSPISAQLREEIRRGRYGSILNAGSATDRAEAQRIATKDSRLGIPLLLGRDVIHGYRTIMPVPLAESASWDPELIRGAARVAAQEAAADGINWTFAPMLDITRDPRWGRIVETLGEDPYLTSALGAAMVRGFQGDDPAAPDSLAACAKHYVGYGAVEGGRDYNATWIPEILLHNLYLPPFLAAREAGVQTFMSAFTTLNGIPASGDEFILRQILRKEWGFDGLVVSDWGSIVEMIPHGYASDAADAAFKGIRGGVDMEMATTSYYDHGKALVERGKLDIRTIDEAVRNILRVKFRLGLFDERFARRANASTGAPTNKALNIASELATESIVLLKNERTTLPLSLSIGKLAVIGPFGDSAADQMGPWVMDGDASAVRTPLIALRERLGKDRVLFAPGLRNARDISHDGFAAALDAARAADAVLLFLGEEAAYSGEARSLANLDLPGAQEALIAEIAKLGKPTTAIIFAGRPLTFHNAAAHADAVLYAWYPGAMGGPAITSLLFGDAVPSAKLTITFPRTVGQIPIYYSHLNTGRPPLNAEGAGPVGTAEHPEGYTSRYIDIKNTPEYPFGFGLSYTHFEYSNLRLSIDRLRSGEKLTVSADVANTGKYDGDEIVQLYTRQLVASVARPVRELKGFRRVHLKAGEHQTVAFTLSADDLAFWNEHNERTTEPGTFHVWIAPDSASGLQGQFELAK